MYLSGGEKRNILNYLERYTEYDVAYMAKSKSDKQLVAMYERIKEAMGKYPKEIFDYLRANPNVLPRYTLEELVDMTYNELSELRASYGLKGKRKKVVKQEACDKSIIGKACSAIRSQETRELAGTILVANELERLNEDRDLEILTEEEVRMMYGDDLTRQELMSLGIVLDKASEDSVDEEDRRMTLISELLETGISIAGKELSFSELLLMSDEELIWLKRITQNVKNERNELKRLVK